MTDYDRGVEQASVIYKGVIRGLKAENAKLREELAKWERLAAGIYLPEYPVTQFKPKDLERENDKLQDENARLRSCLSDDAENARMIMGENAKLRELCADLYAEMLTYSDAPNYNASVWSPKLRELGIEV